MAKKKPTASDATPPAKKTSRAKSTKPARKPPATVGDVPLIDTNLAAQAAARFVAHHNLLGQSRGEEKESGTFKQLKESLNNPKPADLLGSLSPVSQKKSGAHFAVNDQVGHNQAFGGDAVRRGVPRRTPG